MIEFHIGQCALAVSPIFQKLHWSTTITAFPKINLAVQVTSVAIIYAKTTHSDYLRAEKNEF